MASYKDDKRLGSGGFGEVWRTIRKEDEEAFAKKILTNHTPDALKRFQREVRILGKLDHPRIVKVVAMRLREAPYWYIMPLYKRSLRAEFPGIVGDENRIATIYSQILEGMQYAHEQGVIHRDLKPENILLNTDDDVVISDFGLGRAIDAETTRATFTGLSAGTFGYSAPEQLIDAKRADHRADIFSLGRILYELYSGDPMSVRLQDLSSLPVTISIIIARSTKANPNERFSTVEELRAAFASLVTAKSEETAGEQLKTLLVQAISDGDLNATKAHEFGNLLIKARDETDLLHEIFMGLPAAAFNSLWRANEVAAKILVRVFTAEVTSQSWPFGYTDKIGEACKLVHDATPDHEIRAALISAVLEVGVRHNRWHVMGIAEALLLQQKGTKEALAVAHAIAKLPEAIEIMTERIDDRSKMHPALKELFNKRKTKAR